MSIHLSDYIEALSCQKRSDWLKASTLYFLLLKQLENLSADELLLSPIQPHHLLYQKAICYKELKIIDIAIKDAQSANQLTNNSYRNYLTLLGHLFILKGNEEKGVLLVSMSSTKPDCGPPYSLSADSILLSLTPSTFYGFIAVAYTLFQQQKYAEALEYTNKAISINPSNPYIYQFRSLLQKKLGHTNYYDDYAAFNLLENNYQTHDYDYIPF